MLRSSESSLQGDVIGCLVHLGQGGRPFEKERSVSRLSAGSDAESVLSFILAVHQGLHACMTDDRCPGRCGVERGSLLS